MSNVRGTNDNRERDLDPLAERLPFIVSSEDRTVAIPDISIELMDFPNLAVVCSRLMGSQLAISASRN
jgi:hypothetical protein